METKDTEALGRQIKQDQSLIQSTSCYNCLCPIITVHSTVAQR